MKTVFFKSEFANILTNQNESQPKSTATKLFCDFVYEKSFNSIGWNLYERRCLDRFAGIKKNVIAKSIIDVKLNLLNLSRQSGRVLNYSSKNRFRFIRVESKLMKKCHKFRYRYEIWYASDAITTL